MDDESLRKTLKIVKADNTDKFKVNSLKKQSYKNLSN